jgi:hypothetical protein
MFLHMPPACQGHDCARRHRPDMATNAGAPGENSHRSTFVSGAGLAQYRVRHRPGLRRASGGL